MASYHLSVKIISRSSGRSSIAAASYRSRSVIFDERQGMTFDYSKKHDLAYSAIMLPANAPKKFSDRETLWNAVEKTEKRKDSQVSREIEIALPIELPLEKQISLVREFANESFVSKGMIADINIHNKNGNPHAHIMLTMRGVDENGFTGKQREWNARGLVFEWRQDWANLQNEYLAKDGHKVRVDHRSFEDMGIDLNPQVKVGVGEHAYGESGERIINLVQILTDNGKAIIENPNIALEYLTKSSSVFTSYDLYKFANAHSYKEPQFRQVVDAVLSSNEIVQLINEKYSTRSIVETEKEMFANAAVLRKNSDHAVSDKYVRQAIANRNLSDDQLDAFSHSVDKSGAILKSNEIVRLDDEKYTTQSLVEAEKQLFRDIGELHKKNTFNVSQQSIDGALAVRTLEGDQFDALKSILKNDSNLSIIHGVAGAGKSYMLGAARDAFEAEGMKIVGVALSGVAARSLQDGSGIESTTIHSKLFDWQNGRGLLDSNHVLVVDEAGMVGTHQMAQIAKHVNETGAKLILVGDDQQLQAVGAGGPLRGIKEDIGYVAIDTVRRQNEQWQRDATVLLAGDKEQIGKAIDLYSSHGFIHKIDSYSEAKEVLLRDWATGIDTDKQTRLILTHQNKDVIDLNLQARAILKEKGIIGKNDFKFLTSDDEVIKFAEKERVVFTENDKSIGVDNGTLGALMGFNKGILSVHLDNGRNIEFDEKKYNALSHGYAVTIHKSQGVTVDKSYILASPTFDKHLGYVALTRHRAETNLYYSADVFENESGLKKTLGRKREKDLIRDFTGSSVSKVNKIEGIEQENQLERFSYRITLFDKETQKPLRTKDVSLDLDPSTQRKETEERLGKEISIFARKSGLALADIGYKVNRIEGVEKENQPERFSYRITLYDKETQKLLRTKDISLDLDPSTQRKETEERLGKEISMFARKSGLVLADIGYKVNRIEGVELDKTKDKTISNDRELSL